MGTMVRGDKTSLAMGMWSFDVQSKIVCGDAFMALFFSLDEKDAAEGVPLDCFLDAIHADDLARVQDTIAETYAGRSAFLSEYRVLGRDGKWRSILATGRCFYRNDEPVHYPGFVVETASVVEQTKEALDELADSVIAAKKAAASDNRDFISYLLNMVLLEVGQAIAARQVAKLMPNLAPKVKDS